MKREIVHTGCVFRPKPVSDPFEIAEMEATGEGTRRVYGVLRKGCRCDKCNEYIHHGSEVVAQSFFTDAAPWFAWEGNYLDCELEPPPPPEGG